MAAYRKDIEILASVPSYSEIADFLVRFDFLLRGLNGYCLDVRINDSPGGVFFYKRLLP